jgi:trimethylguanosine synthase
MLMRVKRVAIEPSETAVRKQKEASRSQREGKAEKSSDPIIEKYWDKRYLLFERFDEGIKLDQQSWFSVTPEAVAEHIANRVVGFETVLDGFCGAGGDSLKLAVSCKRVISNDIDPLKINLLVNNAAVYGVDNLQLSVCSFFDLQFKRKEMDAVYLAPPWGGPDYHLLATLKPEDF